jgi:hypothetical protein
MTSAPGHQHGPGDHDDGKNHSSGHEQPPTIAGPLAQ